MSSVSVYHRPGVQTPSKAGNPGNSKNSSTHLSNLELNEVHDSSNKKNDYSHYTNEDKELLFSRRDYLEIKKVDML